ncbi:MAG: FG-GAP repeat domain-containing protein [Candidatus Hydrogenedentota bacterium]
MRISAEKKRGATAMVWTAALLVAAGGWGVIATTAAEAEELAFESRTIAGDVTHWWARALGDVNDNGLLDIIVQHNNAHGGQLGWLETSDDAASWTRHTIAEESPDGTPFAGGTLTVGDVDNNGQLDVIGLAHPGEWTDANAPTVIYWYENPMPEGGAAEDEWQAHRIGEAPAFVKEVKLTDFTGDGALDLVAITFEGERFLVYRQDAPDEWTRVQDFQIDNLHEGLHVGDITGNGLTDVAANGYWVENPGGNLTGEWTVRSIDEKWHNQDGDWSRNATKVYCRDITGDGKAEVFIAHSERAGYPVSWYRAGDPREGPWEEHAIIESMPAAHTLQVADFDGNGEFDVLAGVNRGRAQALGEEEFPVIIFRNQGNGMSWEEFLVTTEGIYNGLAGDLQGDGLPDIFRMPSHDAESFEVLVNQTPTP